MTGQDAPLTRASDADRERMVRVLRDAVVDGRLSHDSFVRRIDLALSARDHQSLAGVVADLAQPRSIGSLLGRGLTSLAERLAPKSLHPSLRLPGANEPTLVVGRSRSCDVVVDDPTVSRVHAAFMLFGGQWFVADRDSTNGTRVNGRRIWGTATVSPGDWVSFGEATFRLASPSGR
jgi:hypothetical protein